MSKISCQVALYPLDIMDSSRIIEEILTNMDWTGLEVEIGSMNTKLVGDEVEIWCSLSKLSELASQSGRFVMNITLSNYCGCEA